MALPSQAGSWASLGAEQQGRRGGGKVGHAQLLADSTLDTLRALGFSHMTPVQASTIPLFINNRDVVVEAVTGSGKTLAFVIAIIEVLYRKEQKLKRRDVGAIIVSPTRELAKQIHDVLSTFLPQSEGHKPRLKHALYIGGSTTLAEDRASFAAHGPDIIVGTPGRLEELLRTGDMNVKQGVFEVLVLDEADRLLDMGFTAQVNSIIQRLPKQRRTGLFSATMTDAISELVRVGLRYPLRIVVKVEDLKSKGEQRTPATLDIGYVVCDPDQKLAQLVRWLTANPHKKSIVYFATCACVDYFFKVLPRLQAVRGKFSVHSLHGQMETKRRESTYTKFVSIPPGDGALLLCTDVAARGLDVPDVDFVVQYDAPQDPKVFAHRCGRTARAGREGRAVVFLCRGSEEVYVNFLAIRKIPMRRLPYLLHDLTERHLEEPVEEGEPTELVDDPLASDIPEEVRRIAAQDRDIYEKGMKAFVSFVRSYSKHEASYIFRLKSLNLGKAAYGYGLLRLPKMPEVPRDRKVEFTPADIDVAAIKYQDKRREMQRQAALEKASSSPGGRAKAADDAVPNKRKAGCLGAWSQKQEARQRREERRVKKERKREFLKREREKLAPETAGKPGVHGSDEDGEDEWDALQREERLAKKLRKGKIARAEFERELERTTAR